MSALFDQGFTVYTPSWHKLENKVFDYYPGREEAFIEAGHDFTVVETKVGDEGGVVDPHTFTGPMCRVRTANGDWEWRSYRRNDAEKSLRIMQLRDGNPGPLHGKTIKTVNRTYEPIQNEVPWDMLDAILSDESINKNLKLNYETGGVLEGGASCFVTAYLDFPFIVPGDDSKVYPYLFATWRHDGAGSLNFGETSVRIVCANTRGMAEGEANDRKRMFSFKHTKNVMQRIEDVKMMLHGIVVEHEEFEGLAKELAAINVTPAQRQEFVARFIPMPESTGTVEGDASKRQVANVERERGKVMSVFNTRTIPEAHRLTGWGLYNSATEYLDHLRPTRGGASITEAKYAQSYVQRQITPNRAKNVLPALIREVAELAV